MAMVYIADRYKGLTERLCKQHTKIGGRSVFSTYMQLLVFAAMVGYRDRNREELEPGSKGPEIDESVFSRGTMDGVAYLMALDHHKDGDILRDTRDAECWKIIESYANHGFSIIEQWLLDQPGDVDGVETILSRMLGMASQQVKKESERPAPSGIF